MPLPRHNEKVLVQPLASLGEALNKSNLIVPRLHIVGFAPSGFGGCSTNLRHDGITSTPFSHLKHPHNPGS